MPSRPCRSSVLAPARAKPTGRPCRVVTRCSRSPQNQREWEAQYPYCAQPARSERLAVSLERPHSTGVESTTQTSSAHRLVPAARTRMQCRISPAAGRSRLLYPGCCGRYGNRCLRWACAYRTHRASEVNPSSACSTARVTSSASLSWGAMPTAGLSGASCGDSFSRSSVLTYSAVARVSRLFVTQRSWTPSPHLRRPLGITRLVVVGPVPGQHVEAEIGLRVPPDRVGVICVALGVVPLDEQA